MKKMFSLILALMLLLGMTMPAQATSYGSFYSSETTLLWCDAFNQYVNILTNGMDENAMIDIPTAAGIVRYDDGSFTYGATGVGVIHGGAYSPNNTVTFGLGTGMDENEDHWYASLTYSAEASGETLVVAGYAFILASIHVGLPIDPQSEDLFDIVDELLGVLFSMDDIAIQWGDLILVHKLLDGGRHLLAVDSVAYYDEFYYNDTENFFVLE